MRHKHWRNRAYQLLREKDEAMTASEILAHTKTKYSPGTAEEVILQQAAEYRHSESVGEQLAALRLAGRAPLRSLGAERNLLEAGGASASTLSVLLSEHGFPGLPGQI